MSKAATRDPERTRERIMAAAVREFAAHGFAGARVDAIAKRARINKRMLYHYFGNKQELFAAIVEQHAGEKDAILDNTSISTADLLCTHVRACVNETDWIRLMLWEALEESDGFAFLDSIRAEKMQRAVERVKQSQADGYFPKELDPKQLLLSLMGMTMFPFAFPQITRAVTGVSPSAEGFVDDRVKFFSAFMEALGGSSVCSSGTKARAEGGTPPPPPPPVSIDTSEPPRNPKARRTAS